MFTFLLLLSTLSFSSARIIEQLLVRSSERRQAEETCLDDDYFLCSNGVWCCRACSILLIFFTCKLTWIGLEAVGYICTNSKVCISIGAIIGGVVGFLILVGAFNYMRDRAKKLAAASNQAVAMSDINQAQDQQPPLVNEA